MLFLTDVDHATFENANETRQNNLQSATVSLQVVIGLCKRKETAALKIKAAVSNGRVKLSALRRLFFFCDRAAEVSLFYVLLKFLSLCFYQFFNVTVFVTDHFEVDTITCTIVTVGIMSGIIENVDDFSFIHPVVRGFIIRNTKCGVGI